MPGLIDTGINYRKQANAAFGEAAKGAMERENANRKLKAAEKAGAWNAAGQGVGLTAGAYESGALGEGAQALGASPEVVGALTPSSAAAASNLGSLNLGGEALATAPTGTVSGLFPAGTQTLGSMFAGSGVEGAGALTGAGALDVAGLASGTTAAAGGAAAGGAAAGSTAGAATGAAAGAGANTGAMSWLAALFL